MLLLNQISKVGHRFFIMDKDNYKGISILLLPDCKVGEKQILFNYFIPS